MCKRKKILFASYHSILDSSSGAAISANELLGMLAARHWDVRVLCGSVFDSMPQPDVLQVLTNQRIPFQVTSLQHDTVAFDLIGYRACGVSGAIFLPKNRTAQPPAEIANTFLRLFQEILDDWQPDILLTYGGQSFMPFLFQAAKTRGIRTVFWLRNFEYNNASFFRSFDGILVPSRFAAEQYAKLGVCATPLASPIQVTKIQVSPNSQTKRHVTFVNPQIHKGLFVFARIAQMLGHSRPDIPLLIVESRGHAEWVRQTGLDFTGITSIVSMPNTPDPRDFYNVTRVILMPSL
ncbi:MAG: hypothetical protein ACRC46_10040 [Thermoguttaceae bacterium]